MLCISMCAGVKTMMFVWLCDEKQHCAQAVDWQNAKSIYEFSANDIDGNEVSLEKYRGNVCIIVNVASK